MSKQPIIWKKEACLEGDCKPGRTKHWWSIPFTTAGGLVVECYHCHITKQVIYKKEDLDSLKEAKLNVKD